MTTIPSAAWCEARFQLALDDLARHLHAVAPADERREVLGRVELIARQWSPRMRRPLALQAGLEALRGQSLGDAVDGRLQALDPEAQRTAAWLLDCLVREDQLGRVAAALNQGQTGPTAANWAAVNRDAYAAAVEAARATRVGQGLLGRRRGGGAGPPLWRLAADLHELLAPYYLRKARVRHDEPEAASLTGRRRWALYSQPLLSMIAGLMTGAWGDAAGEITEPQVKALTAEAHRRQPERRVRVIAAMQARNAWPVDRPAEQTL